MAAATISQIFRHHNNNNSNDSKSNSSGGGNNNKNISSLVGHEVSRQEIQAAIAKAVELRALHAALVQGNSPAHVRFASSSPVPLPYSASHFSAEDYPVFTPSYEDDPPPGYQQIALKGRTLSETWDEVGLGLGTFNEGVLSDYRKENSSLRKGLHSQSVTSDTHVCPGDDQRSVTGSCANLNIQETSPGADFYKSTRRNSMEDLQSISSCNKCKPAIITSEAENITRTSKNSNLVVPLTNPLSSVHSQTKSRGVFLSRLFPRLKKKHKNESSPNRTESEEVSQIIKDLGIVSVEALKKELIEANEHRDAALSEVSEMKSSLGELRQKLQYLETYCEGLKKALKQATQSKEPHLSEINSGAFPVKGKSINANDENLMPVSEEVMTEGFLQMVSESRLSVKQFSKTLVGQIEETDGTLMENLNSLLRPHKLALNSRYSKVISYHLEAIINQSLYQDFENCVFQKNGSPKILDPHQDRQAQFASFVALRNLSWNEVLRKGTKYYSEEFSKFCDQKMSCIIATLNWTRPWPEQLLQAFFVAAKCVWLLHLLAFSFSPPIGILRVEENRPFDPRYMEDIFADRQRPHGSSRVKIMVMPGFYVHDRVLRSKVLCRYKSAP